VVAPSLFDPRSLKGNQIGDGGFQRIGEALKKNPVLTSLDLYDNNIGPEGAKHISEGLKSNTVLTTLILGGHPYSNAGKIGAEGAMHIAEAIKNNKALTSLTLDGHALPILELKGVSPVETIELQGKGLTHLSGIVIASCISSNLVLKSLE